MIKTLLRDLAGLRVAVLFLFFGLLAAGAVGQEFEANPMAYSDLGLPNPTVTSDKEDYSPGMTAIISGTGWTEDSIVDVHIEEEPIHVHHHGFHSTKVNADGTWAIEYPITEDHVGVKFTVIVDGLTSKYQGFHNFTDAGIANVYVNATTFCSGGGITVSFRAAANSGPVNGGFNNDNSFIAELSNENGSFDSPVLIGIIDAKHDNNNDQTITGILPSTILAGGDYRVRVRSTSPVTNAPTSTSFIISATPEQVNAGLDQSVCPSGAVILGASNAGGESGIWSITSGPELSLGQFSNLSDPETEFSPEDKGVYTLRWTVINNCGESFDEINITVADNTAPVWVAESLSGNQLNVSMDPGECGATITWSDPTATDNCASSLSVVRTDETGLNSGDLFPAGTTVISYSVTDENENTSTHSFTVTVNEDAEAPVWVAESLPGNQLNVSMDPGECGATITWSDPTATDNCASSLSVVRTDETGLNSGDLFPAGTTVISYSVTDENENTSTHSFTVTVNEDAEAPDLFDVPNDVTVNCDVIPVAANVTATDNCDTTISVELVESNDQIADVNDPGHYNYTITRTWTATDVAGNTTSDVQVITVQDVTKPNLVDVPNDVTVNCDVIPVAANVTATDNCDTTISVELVESNDQVADVNDAGHYNYTITRTWTATDVAGNTTSDFQVITVQDVTKPNLVDVPNDVTVNCDVIPDAANVTATDNCDTTISVELVESNNQVADVNDAGHYNYTITRTWTATDVAGNTTSDFQVITVQDVTKPNLVDVPNDVTVKCDVIPVAANVTATDNCDTTISVVLVQENTQVADVNDPGHYNYTITRTWTATDVAGNTTSDVQLITVQDVNGPIISTEAKDITVESNGEGNGKEFDDWISDNGGAFALDNCSEVTWSYNILSTSDECGDTGIKKVEFIAIDVTGNSNTTEATFTIKDETAPDLSAINAPIDPVQVDVPIYLSATYKEVNPVGATWYFSSDGDFTDGDTAEFSLEANATGRTITNTFTSDLFITAENSKGAGVYSVKLVVVDACENSSETTYDYIVIYDPEGGFVTGGGWIYSEPGSMPYNTSAEGKANFGFNAKYKNGKNNMNEVDGNTNFQFKEGDFHFKSSSHDDMSLVISGAKATYRGVGTVNGSGKHKFMVTAIDGDLIGKTDKFRIRVWANNSSSDVIYDNELTASENAEATTELGGGSIVIHKPKGNGKGKGVEAIAAKPEVEIEDILKTLEAYPNPVVRTAEIRFSLKASANATLKVYDFNGREVAHLFQGKVEEGQAYEVPFDRRNLMPGVYIYRLTTDQGQVYHKQLIIK